MSGLGISVQVLACQGALELFFVKQTTTAAQNDLLSAWHTVAATGITSMGPCKSARNSGRFENALMDAVPN